MADSNNHQFHPIEAHFSFCSFCFHISNLVYTHYQNRNHLDRRRIVCLRCNTNFLPRNLVLKYLDTDIIGYVNASVQNYFILNFLIRFYEIVLTHFTCIWVAAIIFRYPYAICSVTAWRCAWRVRAISWVQITIWGFTANTCPVTAPILIIEFVAGWTVC